MATQTDRAPDVGATTKTEGSDIEVKFGGNTYHFRKEGEAYVPGKVTDSKGKTIEPSSREEATAWSKLAPVTAGGGGFLGALSNLTDKASTGISEFFSGIPGLGQPEMSKEQAEQAMAPKKPSARAAEKAPAATAAPTESPYEQLANEQAQTYLAQMAQLAPYATGQNLPALSQQAVDASERMLTAPGAPTVAGPGGQDIGAWLQQQLGSEQAAAQAAGVPQAMAAQGSAMEASAPAFAQGIENTGVANTQFLEAAPYQQLLQELAQETAYKAASSLGAGAFGATQANTPPWLQQIFKNLQLPVPTTGGGVGLGIPGTPSLPSAATAAAGGGTATPTTGGTSQAVPGAG